MVLDNCEKLYGLDGLALASEAKASGDADDRVQDKEKYAVPDIWQNGGEHSNISKTWILGILIES